MIREENGFTYPLTLALLLLVSFLLTLHLELYLNEKRIIVEENALLQQEYYYFRTFHHVEELLQTKNHNMNGVLAFNHGRVAYHTEQMNNNQLRIIYELNLEDEYQLTAYSYYDQDTKQMTRWIERN
ncbi:competence type IV pilus minor pilin ComGG [Cytobacillus gottheilii]|uniref:Competence protein ComG n=1 Tax=Cytobacillus gottheilii TaxID=859144 RepID=A0ABX8F8J8_9BACI|nr:competence type IV pilus minor pilin ComGG [Cytobacillus gottheilii]QVY60324.1 hypothetical protein J1899_15020 [Cytobacillus gottheilii]